MEKRGLKILRSLTVLFLAIIIALALVKFRTKPEKQPPPPPSLLVEAIKVSPASHAMTIKSYGTVRPREVLILIPEVTGKVARINPNFEEGYSFKKGELLIKIDPRSYEFAVAQREKQLKQIDAELKRLDQEKKNLKDTLNIASSDLELSKANLERFKTLLKHEVIAQATLDQAEQKYLSSKSREQEIENQLSLINPRSEYLLAQKELFGVQLKDALLNLERTGIKAPFDGRVLEKRVETGQFVSAGTPLGRIYNSSNLEVEVQIPFNDLKWLDIIPLDSNQHKVKKDNLISKNSVNAEIIFNNSEETHIWDGRLLRVKADIDEKTRTLPMVIEVTNKTSRTEGRSPYPIAPGMFVNVKLIGRTIDNAFLIPRSAVYPGDKVYLADNNKLTIQTVKVLRRLDDSVYVTEGLKDGNLIITTPISAPKEGTKLHLNHFK
ncbi:MAG: efflux RND transporter periplasmic adaptor subunit [Pseudomonadota bacterium]